ncbi:hypothetical protein [Nesterenkonia rhizosphaerae]|uniref:hypothetical protein n=1 Tax=Nesterenkonia rhizosphaerae TaxID=1348272 RepID=UPI0031EAACC6
MRALDLFVAVLLLVFAAGLFILIGWEDLRTLAFALMFSAAAGSSLIVLHPQYRSAGRRTTD